MRREYTRLSLEKQQRFDDARTRFVEALRHRPPRFPPGLRVKRVQGHEGVWELSWAPDGRATFEYGPSNEPVSRT